MDHPIPGRRSDLVLIEIKRTCHQVDLALPTDHRVKIKASKKTG